MRCGVVISRLPCGFLPRFNHFEQSLIGEDSQSQGAAIERYIAQGLIGEHVSREPCVGLTIFSVIILRLAVFCCNILVANNAPDAGGRRQRGPLIDGY